MVEEALDLGAVAGGALRVGTATCMHQQRHRARQLRVALRSLLFRHSRPRLVDLARVRLRDDKQSGPVLTY